MEPHIPWNTWKQLHHWHQWKLDDEQKFSQMHDQRTEHLTQINCTVTLALETVAVDHEHWTCIDPQKCNCLVADPQLVSWEPCQVWLGILCA